MNFLLIILLSLSELAKDSNNLNLTLNKITSHMNFHALSKAN